MKIWFDMDGTIANLYGVEGWLSALNTFDPSPYEIAKPLVNLSRLARYLNRLQAMGHEIGIISWLSKYSTPEYDKMVTDAKKYWLSHHMPSVQWDEIIITSYGVNKWETCGAGILFDDEDKNRNQWKNGAAFKPEHIFEILISIVKAD